MSSFNPQPELENLKTIYLSIVNGYSYIPSLKVYIKHLSELENIDIAAQKSLLIEKYIQNGITSYKERLKFLIESGDWSEKLEDDILGLRMQIVDNEKNSKVLKEQRESILEMVKIKRSELAQILLRKRMLMGSTAEDFASTDISSYINHKCFYQDPALTLPLFNSLESFEELSEEDYTLYNNIIDETINIFTESIIRKIAAMPFFINIFSYVKDDITKFLGKSIVQFSNYQFLLCSLGSRNLSILQNGEGEPPELLDDSDIEKIVNWYDTSYSVIVGKRKGSK